MLDEVVCVSLYANILNITLSLSSIKFQLRVKSVADFDL